MNNDKFSDKISAPEWFLLAMLFVCYVGSLCFMIIDNRVLLILFFSIFVFLSPSCSLACIPSPPSLPVSTHLIRVLIFTIINVALLISFVNIVYTFFIF